jgi:hypothetical protein
MNMLSRLTKAGLAAGVLALALASSSGVAAEPKSVTAAHEKAGVACADCHVVDKTKKSAAKPNATNTSREQCIECHKVEKLVQKTADVKPQNPHVSPHWGTQMECSACHVQHSEPVNYCAHCHNYEFKMP